MLPVFKPVFPGSVLGRKFFRGIIVGLLAGIGSLIGGGVAEKQVVRIPVFSPEVPFESIKQAAKSAVIEMRGYAPLEDGHELTMGDGVTVLLSLRDGHKHRQWLLEVLATEVAAEEKARPFDSVTQYSSSGHEFVFSGGRSALTMRMIGPLQESDLGKSKALNPKISRRRILISSDFQSLGLQGVPGMALHMRALKQANPEYQAGDLSFADRPFTEEEIASESHAQVGKHFTKEDERAFIGGLIALKEMVVTVSRTPGLDDIMMKVVDVPWWALARSLGKVHLNINGLGNYQELKTRNVRLSSDGRVYTWPNKLIINGHDAAVFNLLVVEPKAPLGIMAGVIGMTAGHVDGEGPVFNFTILATRVASVQASAE